MKEATGELNMTVITIVAIAAIAGFFTIFILPMIKNSIATKTCEASYSAEECECNKGTCYVNGKLVSGEDE